MPEPSERDDLALANENHLLTLRASQHYTELTRLAEMYNKLANRVNALGPDWRVETYSISDYLDRICGSTDLTLQPQRSKTEDVKVDQIFSIVAYRTDALRMLAFDDDAVGLKGELFVPSASEVLDALAKISFGEERDTFGIVFSAQSFPGFQARAKLVRGEEDRILRRELGIDFQALTKFGRYTVTMGSVGGGTYYRIDSVQVPVNRVVNGRALVGKHLWLCDALRKYFPNPPEEIYVRVVGVEGAVR